MSERFVVGTVTGYRTLLGTHGPGLTAYVSDSAFNYRTVAAYRSEASLGPRGRLGKDGAIARATEKARELNEWADAQ